MKICHKNTGIILLTLLFTNSVLYQYTITHRKIPFYYFLYFLDYFSLFHHKNPDILLIRKFLRQNYRFIYFCFDQFIILCPLAVTFRILNTRSTDNQLYLIAHPNNTFHRIFTYVFPIIQWFITVAAGSVKCGLRELSYSLQG